MWIDRVTGPGRLLVTGWERCRGFSLIEMVITLAVASLIFFIALPGYQRLMLKSYRAAGKGALLDVLARQEQYFANYKVYARSLGDLGLPEPHYIDAQVQTVVASQAVYKVELVFDADIYLGARAIPQNRQGSDSRCHTFSISRDGVRAVSGSLSHEPGICW